METGDNMGELTRYTKMMYENRLRKLASIIIEQNLDPAELMKEFAGFRALQSLGSDKESSWRGNVASQAAASNQSYLDKWRAGHDAEVKQRQAEKQTTPAASNVHQTALPQEDVTQMASQLSQHLKKFGYSDQDIDKMVKHAIEKKTRPVSVGAGIDPEIAKQLGNPVSAHAQAGFKGDANQSDSDIAAGVSEPILSNMTNAEKAWFRDLTPDQKRQFIYRHDFHNAGKTDINPSNPDFHKVQDIALAIKQRNPHFQDDAATFRAAAGLWNRHKIRNQLKDMMGSDDPENPMPDHDDLLHKDHREQTGLMLNDWCLLAGVENKEGKVNKV